MQEEFGWIETKLKHSKRYTWTEEKVEEARIVDEEEWVKIHNEHSLGKTEETVWSNELADQLVGRIVIKPVDIPSVKVKLPPGTYDYNKNDYSDSYLDELKIRDDASIESQYYRIIEEDIHRFLDNEDFYKKNKMFYKRGYLLHGEPGEGKTTIIRELINKKSLPEDTIMFFCTRVPGKKFIKTLNTYEPERLKIFVFEELHSSMNEGGNTQAMLDFLDGETSVNKSIVIGTTNYAKELPHNIVDRPSRFDFLIEVKSPKEGEISLLVKQFTENTPTEEDTALLKGLSTAAIKEICLITIMQGISIERAVKILKDRTVKARTKFNSDDGVGIGFNTSKPKS